MFGPITKNKMCEFLYNFFCEIFLILRGIERDMIKNVYSSSCKVPVILVRLLSNLNFLDSLSKNTQISNIMKIRPVESELYQADRRTDGRTDRHDEANSRFSQFCQYA
jgi:hypothetical protein